MNLNIKFTLAVRHRAEENLTKRLLVIDKYTYFFFKCLIFTDASEPRITFLKSENFIQVRSKQGICEEFK